ncbi:MAG: hypothetical protein AAB392_01310 [Patescibacteria group bacterium]
MENDLALENSPPRPLYSKQPLVEPVVEPEKKQRIKLWVAWFLCIVALVVDIIELVLFYLGDGLLVGLIGEIVAIGASFVFWVWFLILGVSYSSNTKRFMSSIVTYVLELIPALDGIPFWFFWTMGMALIITLTRMEDRGQEPTISGALGRMFAWTNPITMFLYLPIQKYKDVKRRKRQKKEREKEALEIAENPENEEEIKQKYAKRAKKAKIKELNPVERTEHKFFKITPEGVSLREGKNINDFKSKIGEINKNLPQTRENNVLNLKKPS